MQQKNTAIIITLTVIVVGAYLGYLSLPLFSAAVAADTTISVTPLVSSYSNIKVSRPAEPTLQPSPTSTLIVTTPSAQDTSAPPQQLPTLQISVTGTATPIKTENGASSPATSPSPANLPPTETSLPPTVTEVISAPAPTMPETPIPDEATAPGRAPMPVSLKIPVLAVDAPIVSVGLDRNGFMAAPDKADIAGWYNLGPRPGEPSNAIIAGHVDWLGEDGVFAQLHSLRVGDIVEVHSQAGFSFRYVVESIQTYQNNTAPVAEIFGGTAEPILTLITCTGPYDARAAEYRDRLVIRAKVKTE